MKWLAAILAALVLGLAAGAPLRAQDSMPAAPYAYRQLDDPAKEAKASALMHTLRCLTCQGQSIADSDASIAGDMRHLVRTRIAAGEEPEAVRSWLIERYGDYISYKPEVSTTTWPLYALPLVLLIGALLVFRRRLGRKRA